MKSHCTDTSPCPSGHSLNMKIQSKTGLVSNRSSRSRLHTKGDRHAASFLSFENCRPLHTETFRHIPFKFGPYCNSRVRRYSTGSQLFDENNAKPQRENEITDVANFSSILIAITLPLEVSQPDKTTDAKILNDSHSDECPEIIVPGNLNLC